jgi:hypothetical protein
VNASDLLNAKAREYEVLIASHCERAPLGDTEKHLQVAMAFSVVAIALREVAAALDEAA